jgi:hypothetical protein
VPIPLTSYLNATCTAPSGNPQYASTCSNAEAAKTNGAISSFVTESMPAAGPLTVRGITFSWPGQSEFYSPAHVGPPIRFDTILDGKDPIDLGGRSGYASIALLVTGFETDYNGGAPYTVNYADGTTSTTQVWLRDWKVPSSESDIPGIRVQTLGWFGENVNLAPAAGSIQLRLIPVDPTKELRSLTLAGGEYHTLTYAVSLTNVVPTGGGPTDGPRYTAKGPVEAKYQATGPWTVDMVTTTEPCDSKGNVCDVYVPQPFGTRATKGGSMRHPIIVWANGSGVATERYDYMLRHFASWGFVVVASRDGSTGDGVSPTDAANYMIEQDGTSGSAFAGKLDTAHIGVTGHSQGGGSAMGLFARQTPPFSAYVAIHPSPSWFCYAACDYLPGDLSNGEKRGAILYIQSVGDGGAGDTQSYYDQTPDTATKAFGVLAHAKHDDSMGNPHCRAGTGCITGVYGYLGYSTAWFMWQLQGAEEDRAAFVAGTGEFNQPDDDWKHNISNVGA